MKSFFRSRNIPFTRFIVVCCLCCSIVLNTKIAISDVLGNILYFKNLNISENTGEIAVKNLNEQDSKVEIEAFDEYSNSIFYTTTFIKGNSTEEVDLSLFPYSTKLIKLTAEMLITAKAIVQTENGQIEIPPVNNSSGNTSKKLTMLSLSGTAQVEKTPTGFYYPIGKATFNQSTGTWLARDPANGGKYGECPDNKPPDVCLGYHIGVDMMAIGKETIEKLSNPVYAITDGIIFRVKQNGTAWGITDGIDNAAVFVKHTLSDGKEFLALYGHIQTTLKEGSEVKGGSQIGTIGYYESSGKESIHLHFGIHETLDIPTTSWGIMPNASWPEGGEPDTNGFVDPMQWITTKYPKGSLYVFDFWMKADDNKIIYANPTNATTESYNFDAWYKIKNPGDQPVIIKTLALAIHDSNNNFLWNMKDPETNKDRFYPDIVLDPLVSEEEEKSVHTFEFSVLNIKKAGLYKVVAKAEIDNHWYELASREFTVKPIKPTISSFSINNGAENTSTRTVVLNIVAENYPTQYIASESYPFPKDVIWKPYGNVEYPKFNFTSYFNGEKKVYFKVKNEAGESELINDTIFLEEIAPPPKAPPKAVVEVKPKTEDEIAQCPVIFKDKTLKLNFPAYTAPVDIYIAIGTPEYNTLFVNSHNNLTTDWLPYSVGGTSKVVSSFSVAESSLSSELFYGQCFIYWLVAPSNGGDIEKAIRDRAYELGMYGFELPPKISSFTNSLGMTFNRIPTGTFTMGSPSDELGRRDDETQHQVTLTKSYYMQTTEVTQGQWKAVMGGNSSYFSNCGENCPVEQCSWDDIQIFITKLNAKREGSYSLPTEAQWEYAARAGTTGAYAGNLDNMGWYSDNSGNKTHSVAQKSPNAWGLYDMHGNVWELCEDWYGAYPSGSVTDPVGASSGSDHVLRGGSGFGSADSCRSGFRFNFTPNLRSYRIGFRLVYSASASPSLSIAISGEPQVDENSGSQYTCTATYSNGTKPVDITKSATWIDNSSYAGIDVSSGYLTTYSVDADQPCTITATYGGKSATYGVTIKDKPVLTVTGTWSYGYYDLSCDGLIEGTFSIYINSNGTFLRTHTSGGVAGTKDGGIWTLTGKQIILNAKGYDNEYGNKIDGYGSILTGTFNSTYTKIEKGTFTHAETPGGCWYAER